MNNASIENPVVLEETCKLDKCYNKDAIELSDLYTKIRNFCGHMIKEKISQPDCISNCIFNQLVHCVGHYQSKFNYQLQLTAMHNCYCGILDSGFDLFVNSSSKAEEIALRAEKNKHSDSLGQCAVEKIIGLNVDGVKKLKYVTGTDCFVGISECVNDFKQQHISVD